MRNMINTVNLLDSLGFTIHPDKSKFIPSQVLIFLGFVISSVTMKVCLTDVRKVAIKKACIKLVRKESHTIREVARDYNRPDDCQLPGGKIWASSFS